MTERQIEIAAARPTSKRQGALRQVPCLARESSAAVPANYFRSETGASSQIDCFSKVARSNNYFMIATDEFICERTEEWHVR